ncbi:hypothetical protein C8Q76DRAFT_697636 [Earliella scabrosa]|nr:hypothetical protein C8Q76DRAFT_697636 [Earliella scabrosa]
MDAMDVDAPEAPTSAAEKFPAEIWLEIFQLVPRSSDLHSASVACRKFKELTARALHRDLIWTDAKHVYQNLELWYKDEDMAALVRSLVLGTGTVPAGVSARVIDRDGTICEGKGYKNVSQAMAHGYGGTYASPMLHDAMWNRIQSFTNLSSLALTDMFVHDYHMDLIHNLAQLRYLRLEGVFLHYTITSRNFNHSKLPITELTILNVCRRMDADPPDIVHMHMHHFNQLQQQNLNPNHLQVHQAIFGGFPPDITDPLAALLSLATGQRIKKLTVDASADVFRCVFQTVEAQHHGWVIPATLEELYVARQRTCVWKKSPHIAATGVNQFPDTLYDFCIQAPNIRVVSTPLFAPPSVNVAPEALPRALERFSGPIKTAQLMAAVRDVKALGMLGADSGLTALTRIALVRPHLKMLMIERKGWDREVMLAVAENFKELRRLKIVYAGMGPDENDLVALAPDFLAEMPELHTLELYKLPPNGGFTPSHPMTLFDPSFESIEEELQDILISWNRHCRKLRKVQLLAGYVMNRAFDGGQWKLSIVDHLDKFEDLQF